MAVRAEVAEPIPATCGDMNDRAATGPLLCTGDGARSAGRMNRWWLVAGVILAVTCAVLLVVAIIRLVQTHRSSIVAAVPLGPEQTIELHVTGPMILNVEGPQFSRSFARLGYKLVRQETALSVPLEPIWFRTEVSGVSTARVSILSFTVGAPGHYMLRVEGIEPGARTDQHRLVITRDTRSRSILTVIAIVVSSLGLAGSVALSIIAFLVNEGS